MLEFEIMNEVISIFGTNELHFLRFFIFLSFFGTGASICQRNRFNYHRIRLMAFEITT